MNSGNTFIAEAIDLTHEALAVCKMADGFTVFVEDLLVGEQAQILITSRKKSYGFGKVIKRMTTSPNRVTPPSDDFTNSGGCHLMHMNYPSQLDFKTQRIEKTFNRFSLSHVKMMPIIGMDNPYFYRNKGSVKFSNGPKGIEVGFYEAKTHDVIPLKTSYIMPKDMDDVILAIKDAASIHKIPAFDRFNTKGVLEAATVRRSSKTGEFSIVLTINPKHDIHILSDFVVTLIKEMPQIISIGIKKGDSYHIKNVFGTKGIIDSIFDLNFFIGPNSFFQVNKIQTEKMYQRVIAYADLQGDEIVVDTYTGIGTIALSIAKSVKKVYGIEVIEDAIKDARQNAITNNIENASFEVAEAEDWLLNNKSLNVDVLIVDPPRKGLERILVDTIIDMRIPKVIYVSCDPDTLARDLKIMTDANYEIIEATPFDMFPQTFHIETVVLLKLK